MLWCIVTTKLILLKSSHPQSHFQAPIQLFTTSFCHTATDKKLEMRLVDLTKMVLENRHHCLLFSWGEGTNWKNSHFGIKTVVLNNKQYWLKTPTSSYKIDIIQERDSTSFVRQCMSTLCLLDITTCDQISQTFPLVKWSKTAWRHKYYAKSPIAQDEMELFAMCGLASCLLSK